MKNLRKLRSDRKTLSKILKKSISYIALISIAFIGMPNISFTQTDSQKSGKTVRGQSEEEANKMPARSFSEFAINQRRYGPESSRIAKYYVYQVEFKSRALRRKVFTDQKVSRIKNVHVLTAFDRFADVFADSFLIWAKLLANPDILHVESPGFVTAPRPPKITTSKLVSQAPTEIVRGGRDGLTGKNVTIAFLDSGIDFRHKDFITYDSQKRPTSRIRYLWDTGTEYQKGRGTKAPFKFPDGSSIGTLYTKEQLTRELRKSTESIPDTDLFGHGTACASVAAGNGNAGIGGKYETMVKGVAPDAEIIGVSIGKYGETDKNGVNTYLLNAIAEWLETVAGNNPLVVTTSMGHHNSGHDGQSVEERHLEARFPLYKTGRSFVVAAGNERDDPFHARVSFSNKAKVVKWNAAEKSRWIKVENINIYYDSDDEGIMVGQRTNPMTRKTITPLVRYKNYYRGKNPITKKRWDILKLDRGSGYGEIYLRNRSGRTTVADLYFQFEKGKFNAENSTPGHMVISPATMRTAIAVGSYNFSELIFEDGEEWYLKKACDRPYVLGVLSCYSSWGPSRQKMALNGKEVVKPEIVAPGGFYISSHGRNAHMYGPYDEYDRRDPTGQYISWQGTSAAAPYVAGVIALMFEKNPDLTLGEVRDLLKANATKRGLQSPWGKTAPIPNKEWGYGKLDLVAVDKILECIDRNLSCLNPFLQGLPRGK